MLQLLTLLSQKLHGPCEKGKDSLQSLWRVVEKVSTDDYSSCPCVEMLVTMASIHFEHFGQQLSFMWFFNPIVEQCIYYPNRHQLR